MSEKLVLGPLLSLENDNKYVVCFLSKTNQKFSVLFDNMEIKAQKLGHLKFGFLYRAELIIPCLRDSQDITYKIKENNDFIKDTHNRDSWDFFVPAKDKKARLAYESYENLLDSNVLKQKSEVPYSVLILNEFNLFDEEIHYQISEIEEWSKSNLDDFFEKLYIKKWSHKDISLALATVPNIVMCNDNNILKQLDLKESKHEDKSIYDNLNSASKKYFEIFHLRTIKNNTLLTKDRSHFSFSLKFGDHHILSLDENSKENQSDIITKHLENKKSNENLMILCDK